MLWKKKETQLPESHSFIISNNLSTLFQIFPSSNPGDHNSFLFPILTLISFSHWCFGKAGEEERKKEPHIRGSLESTPSVTFNGSKQTVSAEGKWALRRQQWEDRVGGGSDLWESPPITLLWAWVAWAASLPYELGSWLHLPACFPTCVMSITLWGCHS